MRHIFIVNPHSGPHDATADIKAQLSALHASNQCELYITKGPGDATGYVRQVCQSTAEPLRFYACGGDGTLNEVVNGAAGFAQAAVGCYPCGSGNDFVKYYGGKRHFTDIGALLTAQCQQIDLLRVNDLYAINVVNMGFEAKAADRMVRYRRLPGCKGAHSYYPAIVVTLLDGLRNSCRITADGKALPFSEVLLCSLANANYVGGSFRCAPLANVQDGLMELCLVKPIPIWRFPKLIGIYQRGAHLEHPALKSCLYYQRARKVEIDAAPGFLLCLDGEIITGSHFEVALMPKMLRFIVPKGACHTKEAIDLSLEKAI